jgi:hypothetical protein
MNPPNVPRFPARAYDALLDLVECQLLIAMTAALDVRDSIPRRCIDEFADESLGRFSMPPPRRFQSCG